MSNTLRGVFNTTERCFPKILSVVAIWSGVAIISLIPNSRSLIPPLYCIPGVLGAILVISLDFSNKYGLLFSYWISSLCYISHLLRSSFVNHCSCSQSCSLLLLEHSDVVGVGQLIDCRTHEEDNDECDCVNWIRNWKCCWSPHVEGAIQTSVRAFHSLEDVLTEVFIIRTSNRVPWIVIIVCEVAFASLMIITRFYVANENRKRDLEHMSDQSNSEEISTLR